MIIPIKKQDYQPAQSAPALARAIQTFTSYQLSQATGTDAHALVGPCTRVIGIKVVVVGSFGSGESVAAVLRKLDKNGVLTALSGTITLNSTTITASGTVDFSSSLLNVSVEPGDILRLTRTYVSGTPSDPEVAIVVQAGI